MQKFISDLHQEVDEERHPGVEGEGADGGHVGERPEEEAGALAERGEQHGGRHLAHDAPHVLGVRLGGAALRMINEMLIINQEIR